MIKNKKIFALIASSLVAASFMTGCGPTNVKDEVEQGADDVKDDVEDAGDDVKEGIEDAGDDVKDATESLYEKVTDNTMQYSNEDFVKSLNEKGIEVTDFDDDTEYFTGEEYGYKVGDGIIYVYEYETDDIEEIKTDINSIKDNGNQIKDEVVQWTKAPHIYKKGRILVVYDGNDESLLNNLKEMLGDSIVG